jgi:serine/threonine-protein kinase
VTIDDESRYTLVSRLARGGMGELHLARERLAEGIERMVVVKRLPPDLRDDPEHRAMLLDEARILSRLSHPGVVQLLAVGAGSEPYLVLELIDGPSVSELSTRMGRLPFEIALSICLSIAETLGYIHDARDELGRGLKIVHRDLTPSNVLVARSGAVKLVDFGIARGENRVYATSTGVLKGTCGYMAPEQLLAHGRIDHRVDVFALGVLLYELCCGQHPFVSKQPQELFELIAEGRYAPPDQVEPALGSSLVGLITSCLSTSPEGRPPTMRVVAAAMREELRRVAHVPTQGDLAALVLKLRPPETAAPSSRQPPAPDRGDDARVTAVVPPRGRRSR